MPPAGRPSGLETVIELLLARMGLAMRDHHLSARYQVGIAAVLLLVVAGALGRVLDALFGLAEGTSAGLVGGGLLLTVLIVGVVVVTRHPRREFQPAIETGVIGGDEFRSDHGPTEWSVHTMPTGGDSGGGDGD
jgi:hypothetical protein